jgi:hypothetical protein
MAIAQHYGMPTPFLDFTTDPDVAAFFASDISGELRPKQYACILCLNRETLKKSWAELNKRHSEQQGFELVRVIEIGVKNLWRLQAQKGIFLDIRVDPNFFEMFSFMLHIYFPLPEHHDGSLNAKYYPVNKSHVELLLDQHFLIETYEDREKHLLEMFGTKITAGHLDFTGEAKCFKGESYPDVHASWTNDALAPWLIEPDEIYEGDSRVHTLTIDRRLNANAATALLRTQIVAILKENGTRYRLSNAWLVQDETGKAVVKDGMDEDGQAYIGVGVRLIYDGMRPKPYEDKEIASAIASYITLSCYPFSETMNGWWGEVIGIEMDGGGVRVRGFCSKFDLANALRLDFASHLTEEAAEEFKRGGIEEALGMLIDPYRMFDMGKFRKIFAEQIIPTTAQIRVEGNVLHFNFADLRVFGLA